MIAKYEDIEVIGESKEQCLLLIKEAKGSLDVEKNEIVLGDIDESEVEFVYGKKELNLKREKELKNLTINNISCTESNLFKMAVKHNVMPSDGMVTWIGVDNSPVDMTKDELGQLIGMGAGAVEEIYLRYRQLKDEI